MRSGALSWILPIAGTHSRPSSLIHSWRGTRSLVLLSSLLLAPRPHRQHMPEFVLYHSLDPTHGSISIRTIGDTHRLAPHHSIRHTDPSSSAWQHTPLLHSDVRVLFTHTKRPTFTSLCFHRHTAGTFFKPLHRLTLKSSNVLQQRQRSSLLIFVLQFTLKRSIGINPIIDRHPLWTICHPEPLSFRG